MQRLYLCILYIYIYLYYITREMKLTSIFFRNARKPQNENKVPFKAILPLKLRDFVSSKNLKATGIFKGPCSFPFYYILVIQCLLQYD